MSDYLRRLVIRGAGLALPVSLQPPAPPPYGQDFPERDAPEPVGEAGNRKAGIAPPRQAAEIHDSSYSGAIPPKDRNPEATSETAVEKESLEIPPANSAPIGTPPEISANGNATILPLRNDPFPSPPPARSPEPPEEAFTRSEKKSAQPAEPPSPAEVMDSQKESTEKHSAPIPARSVLPANPTGSPVSHGSERIGPAVVPPKEGFIPRSESAALSTPERLSVPALPTGQNPSPGSGVRPEGREQPLPESSLYPAPTLQTERPQFGSHAVAQDGNKEIPPVPERGAVVLPAPILRTAPVIKPPAAFPAPTQTAAPPEPEPVHIHIGTIEVRAPPPQAPAARVPPPSGGFDDYERIRNYENWEME
jgi:hypothetical protein